MSGLVHDHSQWPHSRWGAGDQIGAGNLLTVERRLAALRSVQTGRLYDLSHEISADAPYLLPNQTPYLLSIWASFRNSIKRRRKTGATNDAGTNLERVEMTMHVGTHIDALGHFSIGDRLYNGLDAAEVVTDWGLDKLGIEHAPPMIARGVLLDVAGLDGGQFLNPGRAVSPDELQRAADTAGVSIEAGDIVLIRTGWGRFFGADNARYVAGRTRHRRGGGALADQPRRRRDRLRQHGGRGPAEPGPQPDDAGAPARAGRGRRLSDREPRARRDRARAADAVSASSCWRRNTRARPAARCAQSRSCSDRIKAADRGHQAGWTPRSRSPPQN